MPLKSNIVDNGLFSFKVKITISIVLTLLGVILIWAFIYFGQYREIFAFSTAVSAGLAAIYAGFYIALTLRCTLQRDKLRSAADVLKTIGGIELHDVRNFIIKNLEFEETKPAELHDKIMKDEKIYHAVTTVLGQFEDLSICIQKDLYDEELLYMSLYFMIPYFYNSLKTHIEALRIKYNDPGLFCELQKLAYSWESKRYLSSGKKAVTIVAN